MTQASMTLKVLLPFQVFSTNEGVSRIVVETEEGSFGILPRRLDCVAIIAPGILIFETEADGETLMAVDQGVLVKTGQDVVVSVRRALVGQDLGQLRQSVESDYMTLNDEEANMRSVMAKLESGFLHRLASFRHD